MQVKEIKIYKGKPVNNYQRSYAGYELRKHSGKKIKTAYPRRPRGECVECESPCVSNPRKWGHEFLCKVCSPIVKKHGLGSGLTPKRDLTTKKVLAAMNVDGANDSKDLPMRMR
jgi:hypothetical protein